MLKGRLSLSTLGPLAALLVLIALGAFLNSNFLSSGNITNVLARSAFIGMIAVGMTFVITSGGLDLSVGSMAAFIAGMMILAMNAMLPTLGIGVPLVLAGMAVALIVGLLAGLTNGLLVTRARIEPFIVTLGTMGIFRSLVTWLADGGTISLDFEARQFRYTDVLKESPDGRPGVFPLIEYGDTLALRFGYGSDILWVFEGIITTLEADFPADGQPKLTITAVDKRERLRNRKKVKRSQFSGMSEEEVAAAVASEVGLTVATVDGQKTMPTKSKGNKPSDQDALQYLTDRANKAALELLCFGNVLFVLKPNDAADKATRYDYRRGLMSFAPTLNNAGKPTAVRVVSRNPTTGEKFDVTVKPEDLQQLGLAPSSKEGETEIAQVKKKGQGGEKVEVVTNYLARSADEAKQIAIGIMKRNMDQSITVSGEVVGDPRVRVRETLQIGSVGRFGGFYYVTETTHRFGANGYQTSFKARRNTALGKTAPEEEPS